MPVFVLGFSLDLSTAAVGYELVAPVLFVLLVYVNYVPGFEEADWQPAS